MFYDFLSHLLDYSLVFVYVFNYLALTFESAILFLEYCLALTMSLLAPRAAI